MIRIRLSAVALAATALILAGATAALAQSDAGQPNPPRQSWSFSGMFGIYDKAQLQRGFQVYKEVCSTCHALSIPFRALTDPDGNNSLVLKPGKANQRYVLTLFIVNESSALTVAGTTANGALAQQSQQAISQFMARISDGVGWTANKYTGIYTGTTPPGQ